MTRAAQRRAPVVLCRLLVAALLLSCGGADEQPGGSAADDLVRAPADGAVESAPADTALVRAASDVIAFLRGEREFAGIPAADTVVLYMAPEGGDARARLPRPALADRGNWQLPTGTHSYPLVPPASADSLTLFAGSHAKCWPQPLADRFPELATLPHVGAVLRPRAADSCLQAWNLTLVFEADASPDASGREPAREGPRLVAVVYDQWEW